MGFPFLFYIQASKIEGEAKRQVTRLIMKALILSLYENTLYSYFLFFTLLLPCSLSLLSVFVSGGTAILQYLNTSVNTSCPVEQWLILFIQCIQLQRYVLSASS